MAKPKRADVKAHVAWCRAQGLLDNRVPVLWDFGNRETVYWEDVNSLRTYKEDVQEWEKARARKMLELGLPQDLKKCG